MSNELILSKEAITALAVPSDDIFDQIAASGNWLARVQLYGGNSKEVKKELVPIGVWGLVKSKEITVLGKEFKALVLTYQPFAMRLDEDGITTGNDASSDWFKETAELSKVNDAGYMVGPQFLLYLPDQKLFVTYFANNASAKAEAKAVKNLIGRAAWFKNKLVETKKYSWHAPVVVPCSDPFDVPTVAQITEASLAFRNVKVEAEEAANPNARER